MIVLTVTDTNTNQAISVVLDGPAAQAFVGGAEIGLDGADADTTGFEQQALDAALAASVRLGAFLRFV